MDAKFYEVPAGIPIADTTDSRANGNPKIPHNHSHVDSQRARAIHIMNKDKSVLPLIEYPAMNRPKNSSRYYSVIEFPQISTIQLSTITVTWDRVLYQKPILRSRAYISRRVTICKNLFDQSISSHESVTITIACPSLYSLPIER